MPALSQVSRRYDGLLLILMEGPAQTLPWSVAQRGTLSQHRTYIEQFCDAIDLLYVLGPVETATQNVQQPARAGREMPLSAADCRATMGLAQLLCVLVLCPRISSDTVHNRFSFNSQLRKAILSSG